MLFSKSALVSSLALIGLAASQVIVTVTNTIIVTTVTITPLSTSTRTTYVTVTGQAPSNVPSTSTGYVTVTVTASSTAVPSTCPVSEWGQCGGQGYSGGCRADPICGDGAVCKYKDVWYSYCSNLPKVVNALATVYV